MRSIVITIIGFLCIIFQTSCNDETDIYAPKPRGYHYISLPTPEYEKFEGNFPYTFEISKYAKVKPYQKRNEPYWMEIVYDSISVATVHVTYKEVENNDKLFEEYVNDAHRLTFKQTERATAIEQYIQPNLPGGTALISASEGEIPTVFNFWVSDSTTHFLRAALYVPSSQLNDSLAPILEYTRDDMLHMMQTLEWKAK
ncbi:MAG: gliding motility lipoprotein GldD [Bernardetiaceae bacterium]|nr:gliding motility lipoprotein GldD [Bernardetiaceae bacterium]